MTPINATVEEPARGTWVADVVTIEKPTGSFELGEQTWTGTVSADGFVLDGSRYRCRVIGGKGKLATKLREKNYSGAVAWVRIAQDILRDAGEAPGALVVDGQAAYYQRSNGTAGEALSELCDASGATWWVSRDGLVQFARSRPTSVVTETNAQRIALDVDGTVVFNSQVADEINPGQSVDGRVITALRWELTPDRITVECGIVARPASFPDSFYLRMYEAKVDKQNGDGTVDVIANGLFFMAKVRLLSGLPGSRVTVKPGEIVAVGFLNGNRSKPYAQCFTQLDSGGKELALNADVVTMLLPPFAFLGTAVIGGVPSPVQGVMTALTGQTLGTITGPGSTRTKSE